MKALAKFMKFTARGPSSKVVVAPSPPPAPANGARLVRRWRRDAKTGRLVCVWSETADRR